MGHISCRSTVDGPPIIFILFCASFPPPMYARTYACTLARSSLSTFPVLLYTHTHTVHYVYVQKVPGIQTPTRIHIENLICIHGAKLDWCAMVSFE